MVRGRWFADHGPAGRWSAGRWVQPLHFPAEDVARRLGHAFLPVVLQRELVREKLLERDVDRPRLGGLDKVAGTLDQLADARISSSDRNKCESRLSLASAASSSDRSGTCVIFA
jgi:hypothetical protein